MARRSPLSIPSLDGTRALAVAIVFAAHAGLGRYIPGQFGVTIFFFLSGYLITTLLRMEHERTGGISLRDFYLRRVLRIFPPFYLVLFLTTALTLAGPLAGPPLSVPGFLAQTFYMTNYWVLGNGWWTGHAPGTWIFWSLAVEEHFYLFFPLLYILLLRLVPARRRQALILFGLCLLVLAWRCVLVFHFHAGKDRTYIATDTRIDSILYGCVLAVGLNPFLDRVRLGESRIKWVLLPAGLALILAGLGIRSANFQNTVAYTLEGIGLAPVFIAIVLFPGWLATSALNWAWVRFVGLVSYSIYLVHPTVLFAVDRYVHAPLEVQGLVALLATGALAVGIYFLVEKPAAGLRRKLSHLQPRPRPRPVAPPVVGVALTEP